MGAGGAYPNQGNYVPIDRTRKYRVRFWAKPSSDAAGLLYFSLQQFLDSSGTVGPVNGGRSPYKPSGQNRAQHLATYGDTWGLYNFVWTSADWQSGVKFVRPDFLDNYSGAAGYWDVQGFTFTDVTETEEVSAAVQTLASTTAGPDGTTAQYTVKTDVAGHVAGFGLSSASNASGIGTSIFGVTASRFFIAPPATASETAPTADLYNGFTWVDTSVFPNVTRYRSGTDWVTTPSAFPFVVQSSAVVGTGTQANPQIPAGVYIDAAFIRNATITTAKIADLAVDNAKIADLAVDNAKIANLAVDNAKIANLNADKITAGFISADRIEANSITAGKINTNGLEVRDADGKLLLGSGGFTMQGLGTNLLRSSGFEDGIAGYGLSYYTTAAAPNIGWNLNAPYSLRGSGLAYVTVAGTTSVGQVFDFGDVTSTRHIPVVPGSRYEAHVLLNAHRCGGQIVIAWLNSEKNYITEVGGNTVTLQSEVYDLTNMARSSVFAVAPATAQYCIVVARGQGLGQADPYLFVKNMYFGQATVAQLDHSPWSPGRGMGQITNANASTYISDAAIGSAQIGSLALTGTNNFSVKSGTAGARMEMDSRSIKVFDASGVLRVQIGDLTA